MGLSLNDVKTVTADRPPCVLIYGQPGIGKTTLASEFPDPIFLQVEVGTPKGKKLASFGHLDTLDKVYEAIAALDNDDHEFRTLVLDSVTALEEAIWAYLCAKNKWATLETPGYGRGYKEALTEFRKVLTKIKDLGHRRGMAVVLIAHAKIAEFPDPIAGAYSRLQPDIHKECAQELESEMDAILALKTDVDIVEAQGKGDIATGGDQVYAYCRGRPNILAKNRFRMPPKLKINEGSGFTVLAPFLRSEREDEEEDPFGETST